MKFWNVNKPKNEIYIYGDIVSEQIFYEEVTAKQFAEDLNSFSGEPVTIRINSNGGDIFVALAIANLIKSYEGRVTVAIDGICASAATIIACAGDRVSMAANALLMTHTPEVGLNDFYNETELAKIQASLQKVKQSIIKTYADRLGKEVTEVELLLQEEMWYNAEEALQAGFIDEITAEVPLQVDDVKKLIYINSMQIKDYKDARGKIKLNKESLLTQIKNLLGTVSASREEDKILRAQELIRIKNLNARRGDNPFANAIIDAAIAGGDDLEVAEKYLNALANVNYEDATAKEILKLIEDNLKSGAAEVNADIPLAADPKKYQADLITKYANAGARS